MSIPYELIGRFAVAFLLIIIALVTLAVVVIAIFAIWVRFWLCLSNLMWRGYEPNEEHPGLWRTRLAAFATAMYQFEFRKIPDALREAREIANTDD